MRFFRVYGRVLGLLGRDIRIAGVLAFANLMVAGLQFLDPVLFGRVVNLLAQSDKLPQDEMWHQSAILLGIWVAVGVGGIVSNIAVAVQTERLAHRHRIKSMGRYFQHVLALPLSFHGDTHSGRLIKGMIAGTDGLFGDMAGVFPRPAFHHPVGCRVAADDPFPQLAAWAGADRAGFGVPDVDRHCGAQDRDRTAAGRRPELLAGRNRAGCAVECHGGAVVHPAVGGGASVQRYRQSADQASVSGAQLVGAGQRDDAGVEHDGDHYDCGLVGTWLHLNGMASVGEIVSFMGFAMLLIGRLETAASFVSSLFFKLPALEDFFNILDERSSVPEKVDARVLWAPRGEVKFENVSFAYSAKGGPVSRASALAGPIVSGSVQGTPVLGTPVLGDISFTAQPGMCVALVGHTGAGKSTAMALLQRLWDPTSGRITIDGQDLRDITLDSLRSSIGVVFQESLLFNRSIRDNLLVGRPGASDEEIEQACRMADAHEFIIRQQNGYDTMIGERGTTLSGGQRQRLAISAGVTEKPADPYSRRSHQRAGCGDRGACQQGAQDADGGTHDVYYRASSFDGSRCRRNSGVRRRAHRRTGQLPGVAGTPGTLRRAGRNPAFACCATPGGGGMIIAQSGVIDAGSG